MTLTVGKVTLAVIAIIAGILIVAFPDLVRWILGGFLIVWGIVTLVARRN